MGKYKSGKTKYSLIVVDRRKAVQKTDRKHAKDTSSGDQTVRLWYLLYCVWIPLPLDTSLHLSTD